VEGNAKPHQMMKLSFLETAKRIHKSFEFQKALAYSGVHVTSPTARRWLIQAGQKLKNH